jgi:large subunit ribosomal protein L19
MSTIIDSFNQSELQSLISLKNSSLPAINIGDTVSVKYKIIEGSTSRIQAFNGIVIAKTKSQKHYSFTFTVRKNSSGVFAERKFLLYSPLVSEVEILKRGVVRRAKLYYLRNLTGKASRIKEKLDL